MSEFVPVPSVVLGRLTSLGVDVDRVLHHAGIGRSRFQGTRAKLTVHEFFAFWRSLEAVGGSRDLGLRIGTRAEPHQLDVASLAAIHSDNLGDALAKFARYKRVVCGEQVSVETSNGETRIRFHWVHVDDALPMMLVDTTFASLVTLAAHGIGAPVTPIRVEFARRRADEAMLHRTFGCPIEFDAPIDQLVLEDALLARPFVTRNADVVAMLVPSLESALAELATSRSIADDVRAALNRRMAGERPSVEKLAHEMRMSPRTLQRRLGEVGTTYQTILDDVRRDASRRLLASTDLDASEIAFLLGFEELNSFCRALHGWE
ncbi:MAG TPA: AraC family transcriptional regulator, partial [Gemmatimonadaceae bacterium]